MSTPVAPPHDWAQTTASAVIITDINGDGAGRGALFVLHLPVENPESLPPRVAA